MVLCSINGERYQSQRREYDEIVIAVDTAMETGEANDYTACVVLGRHEHHIDVLKVESPSADPVERRGVGTTLDPDRISPALAQDISRTVGSFVYGAQYPQDPQAAAPRHQGNRARHFQGRRAP
jgi:hypothetical protein